VTIRSCDHLGAVHGAAQNVNFTRLFLLLFTSTHKLLHCYPFYVVGAWFCQELLLIVKHISVVLDLVQRWVSLGLCRFICASSSEEAIGCCLVPSSNALVPGVSYRIEAFSILIIIEELVEHNLATCCRHYSLSWLIGVHQEHEIVRAFWGTCGSYLLSFSLNAVSSIFWILVLWCLWNFLANVGYGSCVFELSILVYNFNFYLGFDFLKFGVFVAHHILDVGKSVEVRVHFHVLSSRHAVSLLVVAT